MGTPESTRDLDRLLIAAGVVALAGVAVPQVARDAVVSPWWWALFGAYAATFVVFSCEWVPFRVSTVLVAPLALLGVALVAVDGAGGAAGIVFVLTAVCLAMVAPLSVTLGVVAAQTVLVAFVFQWGALAFGAFQLFGVVVVESGLREARAREEAARLNADLARVNAELAAAQEGLAEASRTAERLRISRDLHDVIGHRLTALAVNLEAAAHLATGAAVEPVGRSRESAKELLAQVRAVVGELRDDASRRVTPPGLVEAVRAAGAEMPRPRLTLEAAPGLPDAGEDVAAVLAAVTREALTNAARHSGAGTMTAALAAVTDEDAGGGVFLVLRLRDDGGGAPALVEGHGLTGMRERLAALGGRVEVDPAPPGVTLTVLVPVPARVAS